MYSDTTKKKINKNWLFSAPNADAIPEKIPKNAVSVELPHSWNDVGWNYEKWIPQEPAGIGWYYKYLNADCILKFEGVAAECEIFLNGESLHHNLGAYKAFEINLTGTRGDGSDLLAVKVVDKQSLGKLSIDKSDPFIKSPRYQDWITPLGSSEYAGGIWRDVWMMESQGISTPVVKTHNNSVDVSVDAGNIHCSLFDADGKKVAEAKGDSRISVNLENPHQWHPVSPYLYSLETVSGTQKITQPVAFFDFRVRDSEFYVNDKPYFLRGQNGFPHCNIAHDKEYIAKYVSKVKEQGVEISRFHTEPPSHAWLDECDKQGIMVIFEMPLHGSLGCYAFGNKVFTDNALAEIKALIKEYRRHPSIAMWSLGNELIVGCERDIGLSAPLFDILEKWCAEVRKLDPRPIISNSGGDGVELVSKSVGDVDDVHQYGGWYTENLRELNNFTQFTKKNDMVFQPMIVTESVAAYTDNNGEFMIHDETDVRQRKVVALRLGKIKNLREESLATQAFILKEYAEAMWRLRKPDSNLSGYIPFGQYTWFFDPFDKNGLNEKPIWSVYRKVMSPVHVQLECWNRHIQTGQSLSGHLLLCHEDISLPNDVELEIKIKIADKTLYSDTVKISYHQQFSSKLDLLLPDLTKDNRLLLEVFYKNKIIAENYLDFKVYNFKQNTKKVYIYDPASKLDIDCVKLNSPEEISQYSPENNTFIIAPFALDEYIKSATKAIRQWCSDGGRVIVLEQNPGLNSNNILDTGISVVRKTQPYWSRWATNMVKHADRVDICDENHIMFKDLTEADMNWWNGDTFLANTFLEMSEHRQENTGVKILSRIGNGLLPDELMPIEYEYLDSGYSLTAIEIPMKIGSIIISSLLIGSKAQTEPVANKILTNIISTKLIKQ